MDEEQERDEFEEWMEGQEEIDPCFLETFEQSNTVSEFVEWVKQIIKQGEKIVKKANK